MTASTDVCDDAQAQLEIRRFFGNPDEPRWDHQGEHRVLPEGFHVPIGRFCISPVPQPYCREMAIENLLL